MADRFPDVSFDWLGNLPAVAREASDRATLKETLADLKSTDPDSLEAKAAQLISRGQLQQGLQLQQAALARRTLTQKGASDALQAEYLKNFQYPRMGGGQAPAEQAPNISLTPGPAAAPAGPDLFQGRPGAIPGVGPQSALPPSPSDAIIAAAQQGAAPQQASPTQLAGPPPAPGPAEPQGPAWLQGAQAPAVPAQQAAPEAAGPLRVPAYQANAQAEADAVGQALSTMPRQLMTSGPGRALMERFRDAMGKLKLDKEQQSWMEERITRRQAKQPDISFGDYKLELQQAPDRIKEAEKIYLDREKKAGQSQELVSTLDRLSTLTKDPDFLSGSFANKYAEGVNKMTSLMRIMGIDPAELTGRLGKIVNKAERSAVLAQEFTSLSNQALMQHVGSFSKSFSDADRQFVERIFPQIIQTPGGIEKIIGHLREMAVYDRGISKVARDFMKQNPLRATSWGVNDAMSEYADKHPLFVAPDGQPTEGGKKIIEAAQPKAPARPMIQPGQVIYDKQGKPHTVNPDGSVSPLGGGST